MKGVILCICSAIICLLFLVHIIKIEQNQKISLLQDRVDTLEHIIFESDSVEVESTVIIGKPNVRNY